MRVGRERTRKTPSVKVHIVWKVKLVAEKIGRERSW